MTRKEMRDQVVRWLGLQDIESYDESPLVDDQLHWGTIDLLARTRCVVRCLNLRTLADVSTYKLDHSVLALVDVEDGAVPRLRRDQANAAGFTLIRSDVLRIPAPEANGELQVWAVLRPAKMTDDTQSPGDDTYGGIPDEFQDAIVTYALWKCADYTDDSGSAQGERYRVLYEGTDGRSGRLAQIRAQVNKRGTARAPRSKVRLSPASSSGAWYG